MKRIFTLLIIITVVLPNVFAQSTWVNDSTYYYTPDETTNDFVLSSRSKVVTRNDEGDVTQKVDADYDATTTIWTNTTQTITTYNTDNIIVLNQAWDTLTSLWVDDTKYSYTYNANGEKTEELNEIWDETSAALIKNTVKTYTYHANGEADERITKLWNTSTSAWETTIYDFLKYDENGNVLDDYTKKWDSDTNEIVDGGTRWTYTYDGDGKKTYQHREEWDVAADDWIDVNQSFFTYDTNGNVLEEVKQKDYYDAAIPDSIWKYDLQYTYTYDTNGFLTEMVKKANKKDPDQEPYPSWVESYQELHTNDDNGNPTVIITANWKNSAWLNVNNYDYTYDANEKVLTAWQQKWSGSIWTFELKGSEKKTYTYNTNGDVLTYLKEQWDKDYVKMRTVTDETNIYDENGNLTESVTIAHNDDATVIINKSKYERFWSVFTPTGISRISADNVINIYPNPAKEAITLSADFSLENSEVVIYSITGSVMKTKKSVTGNQVNISDLPSGVYFINIKTDKSEVVSRFIKN